MIKLVAFDWNGTLFADTIICYRADNEVLKVLSHKPISYQKFLDTFTVPVKDYYIANGLKKEFVEANAQKMQDVFHKYYEANAIKVRTRQNTRKVLTWLKAHKIEAVLISNHTNVGIQTQIDRLKLAHYFAAVLGNSNIHTVMKNKNKKGRFGEYVKAKNIKGEEILVVGDAPEEVEIAISLGAKSIAITDGNYSLRRIKAAKPDYLVKDLGKIITIVEELNKA